MKTFITVLLSAVLALGIILGTTVALASGEHDENREYKSGEFEIAFSSNPRFPVVGQEAEFTFRVSHDGSAVEGVIVTLALANIEEEGHHDGEDSHQEDEQEHEEEDSHQEDEQEHEEVESMEITAIETAPGVYVAKYTFEQDGKYQLTAQIGDEPIEFVVAVRSNPVAWSFVIGLVAVSLFYAGVVAVIKTVRKEW